jgi:hypothetical protein
MAQARNNEGLGEQLYMVDKEVTNKSVPRLLPWMTGLKMGWLTRQGE